MLGVGVKLDGGNACTIVWELEEMWGALLEATKVLAEDRRRGKRAREGAQRDWIGCWDTWPGGSP